MKTTNDLFKLVLLAFAALLIVSSGCKKEGCTDPLATNYDEKAKKDDGSCTYDVVIDPYEEMTTYMAGNNLDLDDMITNWTITASDLNTAGTSNYYIIDLRADTAYTRGHIAGAVNTTLANIVTQAGSCGGKPIVVVCYTGQSAAHGVVALRLSGYSDAMILKFGMSSWNGDFDSWTLNTGDAAVGNGNWSTTNTIVSNVAFSLPSFTSTKTTGAEILAERVDYMLTGGFKGVAIIDILGTPSNYFINNYWASTDVDQYGNITGAHRIKEDLTLDADGFKYLDPDETIVTYCWTGQTSSAVTAYLTVLGYDAKSLKFGANGMIYAQLTSFKWTGSGSYPVE
ncbi:MAG: hypothetical protein KJ607_00590 [Bacteroidetes bacterium]|nr:hypothetical protein [Bacteroidota bacterium]